VGVILILILVMGAFWVLLVLPRRRSQRAHVAMQDSVAIGDEIITAGGLHGHVHELDDEHGLVRLEVAPDVVVTLDRRAIAAVARDVEVEQEDEPEPEADEEAPAGTGEEPS
jgi:preprotein translocase subunit YajC